MSRIPGPFGTETNSPVIDEGTLARTQSQAPTAVGFELEYWLKPPRTARRTLFAQESVEAASLVAAAAEPVSDAAIEALDLAATARAAAYALKKEHPTVVFTSGRRDKADQARAMAGNVVKNRRWITETYASSDLRKALQKWLDDNPEKVKKDEIEAGLLSVLGAATPYAVGKFSKHLTVEAFDVQPITNDSTKADAMKKTIRGLVGLGKFLEYEGGLVRWHAQF